ncbi:hypothetical protein E2562_029662 [Oryza meyeriana var. granulata]|uniref:Uncharacterized protein n=1 Tax=Oryza meyeriana var. granulata TaxID=110450 RepID=A0A6G1C0X6_9ORYZ|nr:hypothetical protein E2562_029662 [Oryza meyeriana var. granulata]
MEYNKVKSIPGNEDLIVVPWDDNDYDGLIGLMEKYRSDRKMKQFDRNNRVVLGTMMPMMD